MGPDRGYTKSVRTAVCVSGADIDVIESADGEVSPPATLVTERERVRNAEDVPLRTDPFDCVGRWPTCGERVPFGRLDRFDGRGEGAAPISREGRERGTGCAEV